MKKIYSVLMLCLSICLSTRAQVITQTLNYTGTMQTFTVPACVTVVTITCYGAQGANGTASSFGATGGVGGFGPIVTGATTITPNSVLNVYVGGSGTGSVGGFNGGGQGAAGNSGGGGGASDVRLGGTALSDRIIVAGGGGGGGNAGCSTNTVIGGAGGYGGGGLGSNGVNSPGGGGGGGGNGTVAGAAGIGCPGFLGTAGGTGSLGIGGNGGVGMSVCSATVSGGGGGGGYNGGGGGGGGSTGTPSCVSTDQGGGGGGAGGSNYFGASFSNTTITNNIQLGNGKVIISFSPGSLTLTTLPTPTLCLNTSKSLSVTGASTYSWSTGSTASTTIISPTLNTTYTVTGTSIHPLVTCTGTTFVNATVVPLPTISVNSGTMCFASSFTLIPSGASTYTFEGGNAIVTPTASRSYTVIGTSSVGCVSASFATSNITVSPAPVISVNSGSVCPGGSFTLIPSGASTYTFFGGGPVISTSVAASYSVSGTNSLGCISQSLAVANISLLPVPIVFVNSGTICPGESFTMVPQGAISYTYYGGGPVVSPSVTTTYSVLGSDANGCVSPAHAFSEVKVSSTPTITVNSGTLCQGESFTLNPSGGISYTFQGGSAVVSPTSNTTYTVIGTNTLGCVTQTAAISSITVSPAPPVLINGPSTICAGQQTTLTASGADSYTWSTGSNFYNLVVSPSTTTVYTVNGVSNIKGCSAVAELSITVEICSGIPANSLTSQGLLLYPNPGNGEFIIELPNGHEKTVSLLDANGKLILQQNSADDQLYVTIKQLPAGLYFVKINSDNISEILKVIKQ